jgi:hypothetical protein
LFKFELLIFVLTYLEKTLEFLKYNRPPETQKIISRKVSQKFKNAVLQIKFENSNDKKGVEERERVSDKIKICKNQLGKQIFFNVRNVRSETKMIKELKTENNYLINKCFFQISLCIKRQFVRP